MELTRKELYEKVWSKSLFKLAPELGLSDKGLAKLLDRHDIPRPQIGYWAKKDRGERTPLPEVEYEEVIRFGPPKDPEKTKDYPEVPIQSVLRKPHPLVKAYKDSLKEKRNYLREPKPVLDMRVTKATLPRASRIMDAVIRALEKGGAKIEIDEYRKTNAVKLSEKVGFYIVERSRAEYEERKSSYSDYTYKERVYIPTGKLELIISSYSRNLRRHFRDARKQTVEDCLPEFVYTMERFFEELQQESIKWEIKRQKWEKEREIQEEHDRKVKQLKAELERFEDRERLGRYLEFLKGQKNCTEESREWLEWVENVHNNYMELG